MEKNCKHKAFSQHTIKGMVERLNEFSETKGIKVIATQCYLRGNLYDAISYFRELEEPTPKEKTKEEWGKCSCGTKCIKGFNKKYPNEFYCGKCKQVFK